MKNSKKKVSQHGMLSTLDKDCVRKRESNKSHNALDLVVQNPLISATMLVTASTLDLKVCRHLVKARIADLAT